MINREVVFKSDNIEKYQALISEDENQGTKHLKSSKKALELTKIITIQQVQLTKLTNLIKDKLISKSSFMAEKITRERHSLFNHFLTTGFIDPKLNHEVEEKGIDLRMIIEVKTSIKKMKEKLFQLEAEQIEVAIEQLTITTN